MELVQFVYHTDKAASLRKRFPPDGVDEQNVLAAALRAVDHVERNGGYHPRGRARCVDHHRE